MLDAPTLFVGLSRTLSVTDKRLVLDAVPAFLQRSRALNDPLLVYQAALSTLRGSFPRLSTQQLDPLAFYLVAKVAVSATSISPVRYSLADSTFMKRRIEARLDTASELNEAEALRLQMAMDRLSKLMSTLSNILKKMADTQQAIVANLK